MPDPKSPPELFGPHRPNGIYVMRFTNLPGGPKSKGFLRGYGFQGGTGVSFNAGAAGFGEAYKRAAKERTERFNFQGYREPLPRFENYVELDRRWWISSAYRCCA